jgi:hypothetical protein
MECVRCKIAMQIQNDQTFTKTYVCPQCGNRCTVDSKAKEAATWVGVAGGLAGILAAIFGGDDSPS